MHTLLWTHAGEASPTSAWGPRGSYPFGGVERSVAARLHALALAVPAAPAMCCVLCDPAATLPSGGACVAFLAARSGAESPHGWAYSRRGRPPWSPLGMTMMGTRAPCPQSPRNTSVALGLGPSPSRGDPGGKAPPAGQHLELRLPWNPGGMGRFCWCGRQAFLRRGRGGSSCLAPTLCRWPRGGTQGLAGWPHHSRAHSPVYRTLLLAVALTR